MKVKIYGSKGCLQCLMLKEFLKKHKIKYKEIDVEDNEDAFKKMVNKSNQDRTPVVEIDNKIIIGYDKPKLEKLLKIKE
ncbi:MAG: glutaredoxin family protein [Candidatus Aenigmarchaeota archaeon]|nr:glutaredoxin family protein [Candidatus Aenigmarchaeota archaeon]